MKSKQAGEGGQQERPQGPPTACGALSAGARKVHTGQGEFVPASAGVMLPLHYQHQVTSSTRPLPDCCRRRDMHLFSLEEAHLVFSPFQMIPFYISNATNYCGRIIGKCVDLYASLSADMNDYFRGSSNKATVETVERFGLYALEEKSLFHR